MFCNKSGKQFKLLVDHPSALSNSEPIGKIIKYQLEAYNGNKYRYQLKYSNYKGM